jgi:hypothetical protein
MRLSMTPLGVLIVLCILVALAVAAAIINSFRRRASARAEKSPCGPCPPGTTCHARRERGSAVWEYLCA